MTDHDSIEKDKQFLSMVFTPDSRVIYSDWSLDRFKS